MEEYRVQKNLWIIICKENVGGDNWVTKIFGATNCEHCRREATI